MKPKVFLTRMLPDEGMKLLDHYCSLTTYEYDRQIQKHELIKNLENQEGLLCLLSDVIDKEVMESAKQLRVISNYAVGYNNIDVNTATELGIAVCNTPGVLTETTADLAWALIMSVARRIVESDKYVRAGYFQGWSPLLMAGYDVYGKTLGIVGMGRIGKAVAPRASGFSMKVLYYDAQQLSKKEEDTLKAHFVTLDELLAQSDFITLHTPLMKETFHLISKHEFQLMKSTAIIINTSRGQVIDEAALAEALESKRIAGAGLDVYENEPEIHPALLKMNNVVLLPHIGSGSIETRTKMAIMAAENLIGVLQNKKVEHLVNPVVWSTRHTAGI